MNYIRVLMDQQKGKKHHTKRTFFKMPKGKYVFTLLICTVERFCPIFLDEVKIIPGRFPIFPRKIDTCTPLVRILNISLTGC